MVPRDFDDFFLGAAGVAGALIGLLFVAVSVKPVSEGAARPAIERVRPVTAFSALLNPLVLSLLALVPGIGLGTVAVVLAGVGLVTVVTVLVLVISERATAHPTQTVRGVLLVSGQGVSFGFQLHSGLVLMRSPGEVGEVRTLAVLVVVLLVLGVNRAWELIGVHNPTLRGTLTSALRGRARPEGESLSEGASGTDRSPRPDG